MKINMMILVRAIKEVRTIQQVKDSPTEQIRWGDNSYFPRLLNASVMSINKQSRTIACYKLKTGLELIGFGWRPGT